MVGLARILFASGSLSRLLFAVFVSIISFAILTVRRPYLSAINNYLAMTLSFSLTCFLILCDGFNTGAFVELIANAISQEYLGKLEFNSVLMTFVMGGYTLAGIVIFSLLFVIEGSRLLTRDPRWDRQGFERWASKGGIKFVKLRFLRTLLQDGSASGLKWTEVGAKELVEGEELSNQKLAGALQGKLEFAQYEWNDFGITELKKEHFIKSGNKYFKPAALSTSIDYSTLSVEDAYLGPPPSFVDIIAIAAVPEAFTDITQLPYLLATLSKSNDDDCIFFSPWSIIQSPNSSRRFTSSVRPSSSVQRFASVRRSSSVRRASSVSMIRRPNSQDEHSASRIAKDGSLRIHTFYRVRVLVLPFKLDSLFQDGRMMVPVILSAYCQRFVNAKDESLQKWLDPRALSDPHTLLEQCHFDTAAERESFYSLLRRTLRDVKPIGLDRRGFEIICYEVQLRWVKVGYIKTLASRGGPFPRQQDLNPDGFHLSLPPGRKFSLSHGWVSEMHPCPSGAKLRRLVTQLESVGADDERDGVFLDYCSCALPGLKHRLRTLPNARRSVLHDRQCPKSRLTIFPRHTSRPTTHRRQCKTGPRRRGGNSALPCGRVRACQLSNLCRLSNLWGIFTCGHWALPTRFIRLIPDSYTPLRLL